MHNNIANSKITLPVYLLRFNGHYTDFNEILHWDTLVFKEEYKLLGYSLPPYKITVIRASWNVDKG